MNTTIKRLEDKTIELTLSIPWEDIKKTYDEVVEDFVKETELPGFRKGKAPRAAVEEKLDKNKVMLKWNYCCYKNAINDAIKYFWKCGIKKCTYHTN